MKILIGIIATSIMFCCYSDLYSQQKSKIKTKTTVRIPKISLSIAGGLSYAIGTSGGDSRELPPHYKPDGGNIFTSQTMGMQQAYGLIVTGRTVISKNKKVRLVGTLGYNLFYNTENNGKNRTKWNIISLGAGAEYNFTPKQKERLFLGYELNFNMLFGGWQTDITYPDNYTSNIYTSFKPSARLGMTGTAGMEIRLSKKMDLLIALKTSWVNVLPRPDYLVTTNYQSYANDTDYTDELQSNSRKEIVYIQVVTGITLPLSYK
jgi:hypothetical protein